MKQSIRTRLIMIFTLMIVFTIGMCWCMNRFLLAGYYEKSKITQMDDVYAQLDNISNGVNWDSLTDEQKDELYNKIDGIGANTGVNLYVFSVAISENNCTITYRYPELTSRAKTMNQNQLQNYIISMYSGEGLGDNYHLLAHSENYQMYKVYDERIGSNYIELVGRASDDANEKNWVYMRSNYQSMQESAEVSNRLLMYVGFFVTLLGVIIMIFLSNSYTKPILRLASHAKRMSECFIGLVIITHPVINMAWHVGHVAAVGGKLHYFGCTF